MSRVIHLTARPIKYQLKVEQNETKEIKRSEVKIIYSKSTQAKNTEGTKEFRGVDLKLKIETSRRIELIDITSEVKEEVRIIGIQEGVCIISTRHTTAGIIINENENGLREDILNLLNRLVPSEAGYRHDRIDNNADSHLKAVLIGTSEAVPVVQGKLELGTWQSIFFAEMDGPRHRTVDLTILKIE